MNNAEYHAKCRARRQQVVDAATVEAAHAEALEIHNAMVLAKIADECIHELQKGAAKDGVLADWNAAARHGGFPLLAIRSDFVYYPHAALIQILNLRKTVLDIKVNP